MIILGIAPGLRALAYSVVDMSRPVPSRIDEDVLLGGRLAPMADLAKKAFVHAMILGVVFERDPPVAVAIGPACNPKEPPEHLAAVRVMLTQLARAAGVRVEDITEPRMNELLVPEPRESLGKLVNRHFRAERVSSDRRLVLASAIALSGGYQLRSGR